MKKYPDNAVAAFMVKLAQEIDLDIYRWKAGLWDLSCPPPNVDTLKPNVVVGATNAFIYCNFRYTQFVSQAKVRCIKTWSPDYVL